jgi:hypothetical protein
MRQPDPLVRIALIATAISWGFGLALIALLWRIFE